MSYTDSNENLNNVYGCHKKKNTDFDQSAIQTAKNVF
jgi:hypothetical protein